MEYARYYSTPKSSRPSREESPYTRKSYTGYGPPATPPPPPRDPCTHALQPSTILFIKK